MNTRKYSRTLEEAFGPYTSHVIDDAGYPLQKADAIALGGCAAAMVCACVAVWFGWIT